jgi:hypothetical protein
VFPNQRKHSRIVLGETQVPSQNARLPEKIAAIKGLGTALFWVVAAFASAQFALSYANTMAPAFTLTEFSTGAIPYPYRRRILMKFVYRLGVHFSNHLGFTSARATVTPEMTIGVVLAFCACILMILSARLFIQKLLGKDSLFAWFALLTIYIANYNHLLVHELRFSTPYDLPSAALFGLACYAAFTRNRWLYYPVFILATFNRESTLFLPLVFFIFGLREDSDLREAVRRLSLWTYIELAIQLIAWQAIITFCERSTGGTEPTHSIIVYNLHLLANPAHWPTYASVFGFLWLPYLLFFNRIASIRLQRIIWLAPIWAAVMLKYADPLEIRTNSEWTIYITVCIAMIVHTTWNMRDEHRRISVVDTSVSV